MLLLLLLLLRILLVRHPRGFVHAHSTAASPAGVWGGRRRRRFSILLLRQAAVFLATLARLSRSIVVIVVYRRRRRNRSIHSLSFGGRTLKIFTGSIVETTTLVVAMIGTTTKISVWLSFVFVVSVSTTTRIHCFDGSFWQCSRRLCRRLVVVLFLLARHWGLHLVTPFWN